MIYNALFAAVTWFCLLEMGFSASFFDKSGKLTQVELAQKASGMGTSVVAAKGRSVSVIVAWNPEGGKQELGRETQRCIQICPSVGFCSAGVIADSTHLCNWLFDEAAHHRLMYDSEPVLPRLANALASYVHESTVTLRHRPYGVRCLLVGTDPKGQLPALYEIDPLGNRYDCRLTCLGPHTESLFEMWPKDIDPCTMETIPLVRRLVKLLLDGLHAEKSLPSSSDAAASDGGPHFVPEVLLAGPGVGKSGTALLSPDAVKGILKGNSGSPSFIESIERILA